MAPLEDIRAIFFPGRDWKYVEGCISVFAMNHQDCFRHQTLWRSRVPL
jgi:hypothetical protein